MFTIVSLSIAGKKDKEPLMVVFDTDSDTDDCEQQSRRLRPKKSQRVRNQIHEYSRLQNQLIVENGPPPAPPPSPSGGPTHRPNRYSIRRKKKTLSRPKVVQMDQFYTPTAVESSDDETYSVSQSADRNRISSDGYKPEYESCSDCSIDVITPAKVEKAFYMKLLKRITKKIIRPQVKRFNEQCRDNIFVLLSDFSRTPSLKYGFVDMCSKDTNKKLSNPNCLIYFKLILMVIYVLVLFAVIFWVVNTFEGM